MRLSALIVLLLPAAALAQQPPDTAPSPIAPPPPMAPPPPPNTGYAPPPPVYTAPPPANLRDGMTFEANIGLGWIHASSGGVSDTSDLGLGGIDLGVGGWLNPKVAITGRLAGVTLSENNVRLISGVAVASVQYWVDDHFWLGGGGGLGVLALTGDNVNGDSVSGFGLDLRVGYTFSTVSENTFNVSFELTPTFLSENNNSATYTSIGILLGYQHL